MLQMPVVMNTPSQHPKTSQCLSKKKKTNDDMTGILDFADRIAHNGRILDRDCVVCLHGAVNHPA
jgi:hypothetical protein